MFTSVIGALTSLLPKYFIFGSYVPVLIFGFLNAGLTYLFSAWVRTAVDVALAKSTGLTIAVAFVTTVVIAYVVSSINDFLREFLEGRHIWPPSLDRALCREQQRRRAVYEEAYRDARTGRFLVGRAIGDWQESLRLAGSAGANDHTGVTVYVPESNETLAELRALRDPDTVEGARQRLAFRTAQGAVDAMVVALETYDSTADAKLKDDLRDLRGLLGRVAPLGGAVADWLAQLTRAENARLKPGAQGYDARNPAARELQHLRATAPAGRNAASGLPARVIFDTMKAAVEAMIAALKASDKNADAHLENDRRDLLALISVYLNEATEAEYANATTLLTYFGTGAPKPTRMGNISAALQSYAVGRYGMDLTLFLSRLQTVLVKNEDKGFPVVLDAKAQLDFLVACCWFSGLTTVGWLTTLAIEGGLVANYLAFASIGPVVTIAFYFLATENYLSYAEVLRACVDINRFALLRALNIAPPDSVREERALWRMLSRSTFAGSDGLELSYEHGQTS